ncbi:MAG: hypothetical protein ACP5OE_10115 [Thermodesulfobium sp.]
MRRFPATCYPGSEWEQGDACFFTGIHPKTGHRVSLTSSWDQNWLITIYKIGRYYTMESQILLSDESIVSAELRKRL